MLRQDVRSPLVCASFLAALAAGRLPLTTSAGFDGDGPSKRMNAYRVSDVRSEMRDAEKSFTPLDADQLAVTLDGLLSAQTRAAVADADPRLRAALMLGSPDFMRH
jgi:hypothetical protein